MKKILYLTVHRKWYDLILTGQKAVEYRECKPYWIKRLFNEFPSKPKVFDEIHFRNGYGNHRPLLKTTHLDTYFNYATNKIELMLGKVIG
ncbi:hypothetical protein ES703_58131 [subsurface metagenome]